MRPNLSFLLRLVGIFKTRDFDALYAKAQEIEVLLASASEANTVDPLKFAVHSLNANQNAPSFSTNIQSWDNPNLEPLGPPGSSLANQVSSVRGNVASYRSNDRPNYNFREDFQAEMDNGATTTRTMTSMTGTGVTDPIAAYVEGLAISTTHAGKSSSEADQQQQLQGYSGGFNFQTAPYQNPYNNPDNVVAACPCTYPFYSFMPHSASLAPFCADMSSHSHQSAQPATVDAGELVNKIFEKMQIRNQVPSGMQANLNSIVGSKLCEQLPRKVISDPKPTFKISSWE